MKILFINISDIKGGAAKSMWRIGNELEKLGHEVKFIVRSKFSVAPNVIEVGRNKYLNILLNGLGLQYKFLPVSRKVVRLARQFKPDVISINQIEGGYFQTRDLIKLSEIAPLVWTHHDLWAFRENGHREPLEGEREKNVYPQIGLPLGKWLLKQKKKIYDKIDFISVLPSFFLRDKYLDSMMDRPFEVIPHGVDLDKFHPLEKNNEVKHILYVAEKLSKCNLSPILERLDNLLREKVILDVIGEGEIEGHYKNIYIHHVGYVEDEDLLVHYYRNSDIFVYPSMADIFGLVVLESIACGTPVVAYGVGGISEVLGEGGYLIKLNAVSDFAFKVSAIMNNDKLRGVLSEKARQQALKFDIKQTAKQYENCFNSVRI